VKRPVPGAFVDVQDGAPARDRGRIDQHVHPAVSLLDPVDRAATCALSVLYAVTA